MPKDNEVDEKVMPVAWIVTNGGESCEPWLEYEQSEVDALPAVCIAEPLYSAATVAELRAEVADLKARLDREEQAHSRTIGERDRAEEALGDMFTAATGRPAEWSSAWGYPDAIEEVEDHVAVTQRKADAAERRVGELEANDRRYRFLRRKLCVTGNGDGTCAMHAINLPHRIHGWPEHGEHEQFFDAAIDSYLTGADPT